MGIHVAHDETEIAPALEVAEAPLYHPKTFLGKYIWSQDAKVIAIQYGLTAMAIGLVALVFSWLMRLQLGFPGAVSFIDPAVYLQLVSMHGMIMVIYLLTALFLGGFGNYLIPLMVGARDMVFPYVNMVSYWLYLLAVLLLVASLFVPGGPTGAGWTLYPPQAILDGTPGASWGIILMLVSLGVFVIGFTMGGLNYVVTVLQARTRGMTMMRLQTPCTSAMSCEMNSTAVFVLAQDSMSSSITWACTLTSNALVISSQMRTFGDTESARAMAARWHSPPLTSWG